MKWIDGPKWCSYVTDDESVVKGQVIKPALSGSGYHAYDNTRTNKSGTTALPIGTFETEQEAKEAVENLFKQEDHAKSH